MTHLRLQKDQIIVSIDAAKLIAFREQLRKEQSLIAAIVGGCVIGVIGSFIWGCMIGMTGLSFELELIPLVGLGYSIGHTVRFCGRGVDRSFAITGALLALTFSIIGLILTTNILLAWQIDGPNYLLFEIADFETWLRILIANTTWLDVGFVAIATFEAYALSRVDLNDISLGAFTLRELEE